MRPDTQNPQINLAKIPVDANVAGAIFVVGTVAICLTGIPALVYPVLSAVVLGGAVALTLRYRHHETSSKARILSGLKKQA